jgi:hypothetical protein
MRRLLLLALAVSALLGQATFGATDTGWDQTKGPQGAWIYVVVAGYDTVAARLQKAAGFLGPEVVAKLNELPGEMRAGLSSKLKVGADAIDLTKPLAIAVFNPMMGEGPVAAVVPVKPEVAAAGDQFVNGYAVTSDSEMLTTKVRNAFKGAGSITAPAGIATIYVDLGTIFQIFGPMVQMQAAMAMNQMPGANAQAGMAVMDAMFSVLGQVENFSVALDVTGDDIKALGTVNAKAGTDIAQLCANQTGGTALGRLLAAGDVLVSGKLNGLAGWMLSLSDTMMSKLIADPDEAAVVREAITQFMGKTADELAFAYRFTPGGLQADGVWAFTGTMDDARQYYRLMVSNKMPEGLKKLMASGASGVKFNLQEGVRQVSGVPVDSFTSDFSKATGLDPMVKQQLEAMWGPGGAPAVEYAVAGGKWVMAMGGTDLTQRMNTLIEKAQGPAAGTPSKAPLTVSMDLLSIVGWGMGLAGMTPPAELTKGGAPITGTVTFSGRTIEKRFSVPLKTVGKIKQLVEGAEGAGAKAGEF